MGKFVLYSHAGSENHGCEALLRTTVDVLKDVEAVYSNDVVADSKYDLNTVVNLREAQNRNSEGLLRDFLYAVKYKLLKDDKVYFRRLYRNFISKIDKNKIYISIGGDNYCYHFSEWLAVLNHAIFSKGAKSVLWGCSINKDEFDDGSIIEDLKKYSLITARESLSYDLLKEKLPDANIHYVPDTAFLLKTGEVELPKGFVLGRTIGLNVSPVILNNAKSKNNLLEGFCELINYIIDTTDYQIALIPHVVINGNDDRVALYELYKSCKDKSRIVVIEDAGCEKLKGYISKCTMFIGARTHATIAAYSSKVPTLVIGYSIKSLGIAKDLFGDYKNFVLPVQDIEKKEELIQAFEWLNQNQGEIKKHLEKMMPEYIAKVKMARKYIKEI